MKNKKIFAFLTAAVFVIELFTGLPEDVFDAITKVLSNIISTTTTVDADEETYTVSIEADYLTNTLTAVVTDSSGSEVALDDATYSWYKSEDTSEYLSDDSSKAELTYTSLSSDTETYNFSDDDESYYFCVTVTNTDNSAIGTAYKYISTAITGTKIQNDIYRDSVFTAFLVNCEGDTLYFDDGSDKTTYNSEVTYTWYRYKTAATTYVYTDAPTDTIINAGAEEAEESKNENTLTPTMGTTSYYYYVTVDVDGDDEDDYTSDIRIATVYDGITVEIEQVKADGSNDITLNMIVYDDNGDMMIDENGDYYYNDAYTTTWYKSKEYFASTGDGTTADEDSEVETSAAIPLGYAAQDYYGVSNYMRVSNATSGTGYTNSITVSGEEGRYYYVDINKNKTNGTAEAGADPVFVRNCASTVVIEDQIATDGTFAAVVYDASGNQIADTSSYTYTWYETVSGTSKYTDSKDKTKTSEDGRFISSYDNNVYYSDSGKFTRNSNATTKTSEYGGTEVSSEYYDKVRDNFSEEIQLVSDVFVNADYELGKHTESSNDGSTCNVAKDEGQLRYYYVTVKIDDTTTYTSSYKYVKYSNQIENGGFQDSSNSTQYDASLTAYWQTTNKGYNDSASTYNFAESYYKMHPLLEIATYTNSNAYGTYGNYYSYPGLSYDKENIETQTASDKYLRLNYDDDSTTDYLFIANQFCEINSTDNNTLYQTVMTVPDMPLYWSLTHHARTSTASTSNGGAKTLVTSATLFQDDVGDDVTLSSLGVTSAKVYVVVDIMYVVIMNETDAESLLANGSTLAEQQTILNEMISSITSNVTPQVKQTSEDGISYLARYDCNSYTYSETEYKNISVWRVQTGSTKVELTFGTFSNTADDDAVKANSAAANAANNEALFEYYAKTYGTVKSYSYSSTNNSKTTYYATFYTESETYADTYDIPDGQYVSRYFFVAGTSSNSSGAYSTNGLSFGTYTDDEGNEQTINDYNGLTRATNSDSAGNFIDNVVFTQQLDVEVNYWLYDNDKKTYVLQSDDTVESKAIPGNTVAADADTVESYYSKYKFVGSYVSVDGGDADTPSTETLDTATSFKADAESALVLDLYYTPYTIEFTKEITGLPDTMTYANFEDKLTVSIYSLTTDETTGEYTQSEEAVFSDKLVYSSTENEDGTTTLSLTLSTGAVLEKGTYLISEKTDILLTDDFDGWFSVDMAVSLGALEYDEELGGFILVVDEDENGIDSDSETSSDAVIEVLISNSYKPVSVECIKSVIFGSTDVDEINEGLTGEENTTSTKLNYKSLTEYDDENSVDDTDLDDEDRLAVLSGDTLTYRMALTSTGNSNNVTVVDTVPEGCTLVSGSIKILRQKRSEKQGSHYGIVENVLDSNGTSDSKTWIKYDTDETTELYKITYDSVSGKITWEISEISFYEAYYVEFEVTVDQIKASSVSELLTNDAYWNYHSGFISESTNNIEMDMDATTGTDTTTYTVTYSGLSNYTVTWLKDTLPDGFTIDTSTIEINDTALSELTGYTVMYYNSSGNELTGTYEASEIATILIVPDGKNATEISSNSGKLTLTFEGKQDESDDVRNTAGIKYAATSTSDSTVYSAVVSYGEGTTNQVETDVTHLYFEIVKSIDNKNDSSQTFMFKVEYYAEDADVEKDEPTSISYVDINCTNGTGSRIVQTDKRGTYIITEVTDWSNTDYDFDSVSVTTNDTANYLTSSDSDSVTIVLLNNGYGLTTSSTTEVEDTAFATSLGLFGASSYETATFTNNESEYAYISGQAYAKNKMTS